jgi:hypothetical protein
MTSRKTPTLLCIATFLCLLAPGCGREPAPPTVSFASSAEIDRLLEQAENVEPMGKPVVEQYPAEGGTTVVCRQALRLSGGGLGHVGLVHCCTGMCKNNPNDSRPCQASGCGTGGKQCGAIACSGGCVKGVECKSCDHGLMFRW